MLDSCDISVKNRDSSDKSLYSRGRSGAENQVKCSILIPDRDDRSVHEIWAANISTHIIIKEKIK